MNNLYLIPANSKKSELILGLFNTFDLILFSSGIALSFILMLTIHTSTIPTLLLLISPGLISAFLVFPVPHYHNVLQLIVNIYSFFFLKQRRYIWKGWCYKYGENNK